MVDSFGGYLHRLRLEHPENLSIREVARRAGIDVSYLSRMEKDEVPPPREEVILKLADVLAPGSADELIRLAGKIPPDVQEFIKDNYNEVTSFVRTAKGRKLGSEDWKKTENYIKKIPGKKGDRS